MQGSVNVLFHEDYTVKNDDADFYKAGEVYEMTEVQATLFRAWCDCETVDRAPTAKPQRKAAPRFVFARRKRETSHDAADSSRHITHNG